MADDSAVTLLIADDDDDVRMLLAEIIELRLAGVEVTTAGDAAEALEQIAARPPDVFVFDIDMRRMSGVELCRKLGGMPSAGDVLCCAISARAATSDRVLLARLGVTELIHKAEPLDRLVAAVERLVEVARDRSIPRGRRAARAEGSA